MIRRDNESVEPLQVWAQSESLKGIKKTGLTGENEIQMVSRIEQVD